MKALLILLALSAPALAGSPPANPTADALAKEIQRKQWLATQPKSATTLATFPRGWRPEIPIENRNP